jgi:Alkylmercury lyase
MAADIEILRQFIYGSFVRHGQAPDLAACAAHLQVSETEARDGLRALHNAHLVVLDADGVTIRMAHPFAARNMGFVVASAVQKWWGGCAWDAMAIGAALREEVLIATDCPGCGRALAVRSRTDQPPAEGGLLAHFLVPARDWWRDVLFTCGHLRMFCEERHARDWAGRQGGAVGALVGLPTLWELARRWYGDRLEPGYRRKSVPEYQAILTDLGLTGDFWRLG